MVDEAGEDGVWDEVEVVDVVEDDRPVRAWNLCLQTDDLVASAPFDHHLVLWPA